MILTNTTFETKARATVTVGAGGYVNVHLYEPTANNWPLCSSLGGMVTLEVIFDRARRWNAAVAGR